MKADMQYAVVFEKGTNNWSAYVPDLPGCVAAADTREEVETLIQEAIEFHIEGLRLVAGARDWRTMSLSRINLSIQWF